VFLGTILDFIRSKACKVMDPKNVEALINMQVLTPPRRSKFLIGWPSFIGASLKTLLQSCHLSLNYSKSLKFF
jgi:hypothetical protein